MVHSTGSSTHRRIRVCLALIATACAGLWSAAAAHETDLPGAQASRLVGSPHRPIYCDLVSAIGVDFLNDRTDVPAAFDAEAGEVFSDRLARFHVYALADDPRFFANATTEVRAIRIQSRVPLAGGAVNGRLTYSAANFNPTFYFSPSEGGAEDRIAFLDFSYHCRSPKQTFRRRFVLTLRGTARPFIPTEPLAMGSNPSDTEADASAPEAPSETPAPIEPGDCPDLAVTLGATATQVWQGGEAEFTVRVENRGPERVEKPQITVAGIGQFLRGREASQGIVSQGSPREPVYYLPGPLEPGAAATAKLHVLAAFAAPLTLSAQVSGVSGDCVRQNDSAQTTVLGVAPPRPDLTGSWVRAEIGAAPPLLRPHLTVRGKLLISNGGTKDAAPTRLVLFLSADKTAGPEDRLLGFADVPALAAGAATEIPVSYELQPVPWPGTKHLLALVDSSNYEYEANERNNWAISAPLH